MNTPKSQNKISDSHYDALAEDLAENLARNKKSICSRVFSFFKSKPTHTVEYPELKAVTIIVNPTFVPRGPGSSSSSIQ